LSENRKSDIGPIRMGSISPVPKGVSQIFGRSSQPSNIPWQINVCWINNDDKELCKLVSLKTVLKRATTISGEALVFEILPFSDVTVYLEKTR